MSAEITTIATWQTNLLDVQKFVFLLAGRYEVLLPLLFKFLLLLLLLLFQKKSRNHDSRYSTTSTVGTVQVADRPCFTPC